jgi:hypothetical protein
MKVIYRKTTTDSYFETMYLNGERLFNMNSRFFNKLTKTNNRKPLQKWMGECQLMIEHCPIRRCPAFKM